MKKIFLLLTLLFCLNISAPETNQSQSVVFSSETTQTQIKEQSTAAVTQPIQAIENEEMLLKEGSKEQIANMFLISFLTNIINKFFEGKKEMKEIDLSKIKNNLNEFYLQHRFLTSSSLIKFLTPLMQSIQNLNTLLKIKEKLFTNSLKNLIRRDQIQVTKIFEELNTQNITENIENLSNLISVSEEKKKQINNLIQQIELAKRAFLNNVDEILEKLSSQPTVFDKTDLRLKLTELQKITQKAILNTCQTSKEEIDDQNQRIFKLFGEFLTMNEINEMIKSMSTAFDIKDLNPFIIGTLMRDAHKNMMKERGQNKISTESSSIICLVQFYAYYIINPV